MGSTAEGIKTTIIKVCNITTQTVNAVDEFFGIKGYPKAKSG